MELLFDIVIPFAKLERKTKSHIILTPNNISKWFRYSQTKIKADYKAILTDLLVPDPIKQYDSLTIKYRIIRHNNRKIDQDNATFPSLKWFNDVLEKLGYVEDDRTISINSFDTIIDSSQPEPRMQIQCYSGSEEWAD